MRARPTTRTPSPPATKRAPATGKSLQMQAFFVPVVIARQVGDRSGTGTADRSPGALGQAAPLPVVSDCPRGSRHGLTARI